AHLTTAARASGDPLQLQQALDAFADLLTADPLNAQHHLAYGNALVLARDFSRAEQEWQRAAELAPTSAVPDMNLARLYLELGRPADAVTAYRRAVAIDPDAPGLDELAELLEEAGLPRMFP
ncbi:MAG TPA: tetratricopeptide repeat protein, partial [Acidimicrobiia bacterium]|nr:tetratricopeptide repeat protein [Acidimicrobiia bacterium]